MLNQKKQGLQLKADFAERKRILLSSSESGFSEISQVDKTIDSDTDSVKAISDYSLSISGTIFNWQCKYEEYEEIPDPLRDEEI